MTSCQISSTLTTFTIAGGLGLLVLGLGIIIRLLITDGGERLETKLAG